MTVGFPPQIAYPLALDSDRTLFLVHNTAEARLAVDNAAWAEEIEIVPVEDDEDDQWAENGFANIGGELFATHDECTHAYGPLSEGELEGFNVICPWHDSCFDVTNGEVTCGPAEEPVKVYRVIQEGDIGRVEE